MKKINKTNFILVIIMAALSFTNLFHIKVNEAPLKLAGLSVIVGIIAFFTTRKTNGSKDEGLNIKTCIGSLKDTKVILLILLSLLMNILCFFIAAFCLPEHMEHLKSRTGFLDTAELPKLVLELIVFALGEEIAWRGFFQKQTSRLMPFIPSLMITSILFSIGHFNSGSLIVVLYDLLFIFIDSVIFGLIFKKTDNAWCSFLAHFLANLLGTALYSL